MSLYGGLKVLYDGKQYTVLYRDGRFVNRIGELLLKGDFLPQGNVLDWIRMDPRLAQSVPDRWEEAVEFVCMYAETVLQDPVLICMFCGAFASAAQKVHGVMESGDGTIRHYIDGTNAVLHSDDLDHENRYAMLGHDITLDDLGGFLFACFNEYYLAYQDFSNFLSSIAAGYSGVADEGEQYALNKLTSLYAENALYQSIGCRVLYDSSSGSFTTEYTLHSLYALLAFEYAHMQETGTQIKVCANCGRLFLPAKRSDEIYCASPAPDDEKGRTCREIGAWISHRNKLAKDDLEAKYRRKYQYYNVAYNRHKNDPEGEKLGRKREQLKAEGREMKKKLKDGRLTSEEFLSWLNSF